jgi:hypothetical protein
MLMMCGYENQAVAKILLAAKITRDSSQPRSSGKTGLRRVESVRNDSDKGRAAAAPRRLTPLEASPGPPALSAHMRGVVVFGERAPLLLP